MTLSHFFLGESHPKKPDDGSKVTLVFILLLIIIFASSYYCFGQTANNNAKMDSIAQADEKIINQLLVNGMKDIRHDAIIRGKFRYAHFLKKEIKKLQK